MGDFHINTTDATIIIGYFMVVLFVGLVLSRRAKTGDDLFLAGRRLGWGAIGFSLFASNISSATILGLAGQAYSTGLSVANYEWMATLILVFLVVFAMPIYVRLHMATVPEYLELRYGPSIRRYFSGVNIFLNVALDIAGSLYAGALAINFFFPHIEIWQTVFVLAVVTGVYTTVGGLGAVVYTNILQAIIIVMGGLIMLYAVLGQFDFSWSQALAQVPREKLSVIRPISDSTLPWLGTFIGVPVLGFYYWGINQTIAQHYLAAKDLDNARWGALLGASLKLPVLIYMVLPGALAFAIFPNITETNLVFPTMVQQLLPPGVVGIVLIGVIAAIMSTVDSALNSASSLIVRDFLGADKKLSQESMLRYGRITILLVILFAAAWAPMIARFQGIFAYLQQVLSFAVPPLFVTFLMGMFYQRGGERAALGTLLIGHCLSALIVVLSLMGIIKLHFTILAGILAIVCVFIFLAIARATPRLPRDLTRETTWNYRSVFMEAKRKWYTDYRIVALALVLGTFALVCMFW
jgi:SSS family solute:Na+ symporter